MHILKSILSKLIFCLISFNAYGMELAYENALTLNNQAKLEHAAIHAFEHFLQANNLLESNHAVALNHNNLLLHNDQNLRTAVAVFELDVLNQLPPISYEEVMKASEHFKVFECSCENNIWTVMFDYSNPELLPSTPEQAGYLLVAPLLEDMPLAKQPVIPSFLSTEQRQIFGPQLQHPQLIIIQRNECKAFFDSGKLASIFKIESHIKSSDASSKAIQKLNYVLHLHHKSNALRKAALHSEAIMQIDQICDLALHEGFALGMVVHGATELVKIEDLKNGDMVISRDLKNNNQVVCPVTQASKVVIPRYIEIVLEEGTIVTAPGQKFYLENLQCKTAQELLQSPELQAHFPEQILEIRQVNESIEVYKLTVAHEHNFYVTEKQLLAHNYTPTAFYSTIPGYRESNWRYDNSGNASPQGHARDFTGQMGIRNSMFSMNPFGHHGMHFKMPRPLTPTEAKKIVIQLENPSQLTRKEIRKDFIQQLSTHQRLVSDTKSLLTVFEVNEFDGCARLAERVELAKEAQSHTRKWHFSHKNFTLSETAAEFLKNTGTDVELFKSCYGNKLQHHIQQDCIFIIEKAAALTPESVLFPQRESLVDFAESACRFNRAGQTSKACAIVDLCNILFIHAKAIGEGAIAGAINVAEYAIDHPVETALCVFASEYVLAYQFGKVLADVADIGVDMLLKPEEGAKRWDEFITPVAQVYSIATGRKPISSVDLCRMSTQFIVQYKAGRKLDQGLAKLYGGAKSKAFAYLTNNPAATPQQYMTTPEGLLFKAIGGPGKNTPSLKDMNDKLSKNFSVDNKVPHVEKTRNTFKVANMKEFFKTEFGAKLKKVSTKVKGQNQPTYRLSDKIADCDLSKGDIYYLDTMHRDHLEVFKKNGEIRMVMNLDGTINPKKTAVAIQENRSIKV